MGTRASIKIIGDKEVILYKHYDGGPISNKLIGFRLRSLNRFVYKINKLI